MKKKLFSRAGAIGLAGISAFSAVSIVASADVTPDTNNVLSGTAYLLEWSVKKTVDTYGVSYNGTTVSFPWQKTEYTMNPSTINYTSIYDNGSASHTFTCNQKEYFGYSTPVNNIKNEATTAKNNVDKINKADRTYWENLWKDYYWLQKNGPAAKEMTTPNAKVSIGAGADDSAFKTTFLTGADTFEVVSYTVTVTITNKTMKNLEDELANASGEVDMDAYGVLTEGGKGSSATTYTLNTTGSTGGTGSTGTTVGGYAAYVIPSGYRTWSSVIYRSGVTWYPNLNAMYIATGSWAYDDRRELKEPYSSSKAYFNPVNGEYISNSVYTSSNYPHAVYITGTDTTRDETAIYKVGNLYYYTWTSAYNAANGDTTKVEWIRDYSSTGAYFSRITGYFYSTYEAAVSASNGYSSYVIAVGGTGYYYDDPYYYYYLLRAQQGNSSSSSSNLGGSSVKIGNKSGWSNVRASIRSASTGTTLNVNMGSETSIPEEILSALDGKNVTVNFTLSNGSVISFNGLNISTPKDVYVKVSYNTTNIPSALVKKAKSINKAVSSAQVSVTNNTFGGSGSLTVKFGTNRANFTAKLYRYNSSKNSLQLIDTSTVASTGRVTFNKVTQGGDYVIVLS